MRNKVLNLLVLLPLLIGVTLFTHASELKVAIARDAPPYVDDNAKSGFEVELIQQALPNYSIKFVQMGWGEIQDAIKNGVAGAEANVCEHEEKGSHYYSKDYVGFVNYAISRKSEEIKITNVNDLVGHHVIAWEGAHQDLGPEFERLFSPGGVGSKNYVEKQSSRDQVLDFWKNADSIAIIDKSIFAHFSLLQGHSLDDVDTHKVFLPVSKFKMAFKDEKTRDEFNKGLSRLCSTGEYAKLLRKYDISEKTNICE
ncbi:transporter substrate-binding domain-containing protein [Microbulbifer sp. OS29]|uniref:Transporter substrate-binding domain-containing protein n=1 Tax=Microbulbifer okhotskensis TaxID=2926617 RepID=A0A9X2J6B1_9GAMM|nr:transporter substrate-binding domain-containing protein [Microbulbifer okhotskensis]MCO1336447.1 transporter substrate-binding domain-containing protein [Microbulbifer okhotskensis]